MDHMRHIVIDIETFDTATTSAIISVAAVAWDEQVQLNYEFSRNVLWTPQEGRTYDKDTVVFWLSHIPELQMAIHNQVPLRQALVSLAEFMAEQAKMSQKISVWGHGWLFDISIIKHTYEQLNLPVPWNFYTVRDTRTLFDVARRLGWKGSTDFGKHVALLDARLEKIAIADALEFIEQNKKIY